MHAKKNLKEILNIRALSDKVFRRYIRFQNTFQLFPINKGALFRITNNTTSPENIKFKIPMIVITLLK